MKIRSALLGAMMLSGTAVAAGPNWAGPYAGLQAGYSWGDVKQIIPNYGPVPDGDVDGAVLGAFAGYNMNLANNLVLGFEAGANWSDADGQNSVGAPEYLVTEQDWEASLVAKLGVPVNNFLVYGLAGATWTKLTSHYYSPSTYGSGPKADDTVVGWTVGAGVQTKIGNNLSGRLEYRYADYDEANVTCATCGPTAVELSSHTVTVGIAMHF